MSTSRIIFWTVCSLAALSPWASAATVALNPSQDAFVSSANPTSNYGAAGALLVNAAGLPKGEFDSVLKFDLSSAKSSFDLTYGVGNWTIQSVTLQLTSAMPNNGIFNSPAAAGSFTLTWMQNDTWAEGTGTPMGVTTDGITYNTLPAFRGVADQSLGAFSFSGATSGNSTYTLNLASSFVSDITAGGFVSMLALPNDSSIVYTANSENFTTAGSRPVLTVTVVPEPGTAGLLVGALGLGFLGRRRAARPA